MMHGSWPTLILSLRNSMPLALLLFAGISSENKLKQLFATLLYFLKIEEIHGLAHELGDIALMTRIKFVAHRIENDVPLIAAITNALEVYEVCRQNRNQLSHFDMALVPIGEGLQLRLGLTRRGKTPEYRRSIPFPDLIKDIRRVARDIRRLNTYLYRLERHMFAKWKPSEFIQPEQWPLPNTLPLPELLWKPPLKLPKNRSPRLNHFRGDARDFGRASPRFRGRAIQR